jgi:hypothetical protein
MSGPYENGHVPPDVLAAIALDGNRLHPSGEIVAAEEHVVACVQCSTALAALLRAVAAGRWARPADATTEPPARAWTAVVEQLREQGGFAQNPAEGRASAVPVVVGLLAAAAGVLVLARLYRRFPRRGASAAPSAQEVPVSRGAD